MPPSATPWCRWDRKTCSSTRRETGETSSRATAPLPRDTSRHACRSLRSTWCSIRKPPNGNSPTTAATRSPSRCLPNSRCCWLRELRELPWDSHRRFCPTTSTTSAMPPSNTFTDRNSGSIPTSPRGARSTFRNTTTASEAVY